MKNRFKIFGIFCELKLKAFDDNFEEIQKNLEEV